jgi:hypothetical protein
MAGATTTKQATSYEDHTPDYCKNLVTGDQALEVFSDRDYTVQECKELCDANAQCKALSVVCAHKTGAWQSKKLKKYSGNCYIGATCTLKGSSTCGSVGSTKKEDKKKAKRR